MPEAQVSPLATNNKAAEVKPNTFFDWEYAKTKLVAFKSSWEGGEARQTQVRRDLRALRIDIEQSRNAGELESDETLVPVRIIDSNITKEAAPFIEYLASPDRLAIFKPRTGWPEIDMTLREKEFTRVMRYDGWILPFIKVQDGSATHGWDSVEVIFDITKPGHVALDHVRHDELWIPQDARNIQDCEFIVRKYAVSITTVRELIASEGFEEEKMQVVMDATATSQSSQASIAMTLFNIYKVMFKVKNVISVAWWSPEVSDGWLAGDPKPLFLGRHQLKIGPDSKMAEIGKDTRLSESLYPYYLLYYRETEMPEIFQHVGRVFLDEPRQEAATTLMSAFVNGTTRASNFVATPKQGDGGEVRIIPGVQIQNGRFYNQPIEFSNLPYPDAALLKGIQTIQNLNADETNSVAFATMARKDSRKSVGELDMAQDAQNTLNGVSLIMRAVFLTQIFTRCEEIVTSRALAGLIKNYCERNGSMDRALLEIPIQVRPAGDVDVVERKERLQAMAMAWPIVATTPAATMFLCDMLRLALPGYGDKYAALITAGDPKAAFIEKVMGIIATLTTDPKSGALTPGALPFKQQLAQLSGEAAQVLAPVAATQQASPDEEPPMPA